MTSDKIEEIRLKIEELIAVPHCAAELKEVGKAWIDSIGTENQKQAGIDLIKELKEDVMPIDAVIAFFQTKDAIEKFGSDVCKNLLDGSITSKNQGARYCTCPACKAGEALLDLEEDLTK